MESYSTKISHTAYMQTVDHANKSNFFLSLPAGQSRAKIWPVKMLRLRKNLLYSNFDHLTEMCC